jgi:Brp/Blh family beta-carotene 15,15'-monooxygenase
MKIINLKHSIIFFNLSILVSPLHKILDLNLIICLFLILVIGISHGSLDNLKGRKLLKIFGFKSDYIFYISYLAISSLIILLWIIFPNTVLLLFLIVACYHFGKEDTVFLVEKKIFLNEILYFLKGSSVIIAPLLFHRDETIEIFRTLNFNVFENSLFNNQFLIVILFLSFISSFFLSYKKNINHKILMITDFLSIIIINFFLSPILAFTLYFCFLHSIRHSITLIFELDKSVKNGFKKFIRKAIPLTLITGFAFIFAIYLLNNFYELNEAIYKVIFIGLASLTFPHILLEYLLEKNEKRS